MPALGIIISGIFLLGSCSANWSENQVAQLAHNIADQQNLLSFGILNPLGSKRPEVYRTVKALRLGERFRLVRVSTFQSPGVRKTNYHCSQVLMVFLAWLPGAQEEFSKMTHTAITYDATWLIFLPLNVTGEKFIGDANLPFPVHIIVAELTEKTIKLEEVWRVAPGYPLHTIPFGKWTPEEGVICWLKTCSFHLHKNLEGLPLRAATKDDMPLSQGVLGPNNEPLIEGFFGDIYYELVNELNATAVIVPNPEGVTGFSTNGKWNGLVGLMERNQTDLAVGPISVFTSVMDVANFLRPLLRTNYQVFFKQDGKVVEWDAFLKPFGTAVWYLLLLGFLAGGFTLNIFYRFGVEYGQENGLYELEFSKINCCFAFLRAYCQQGGYFTPQSLSCRGLYLTGYLTSTILLTAYSAALISKLTLQEPIRPFDSLEGLLKDGSYSVIAIAASTDYTYFSEASEPTLRNIYDRLMSHIPMDQMPLGKEDALGRVCENSKTALFITFAVTQITAKEMAISRKCHILHFKKELGTVFLTIGVRKNMPYAAIINHRIQMMAERGILKRMQHMEWPLHTYKKEQVPAPEVEIEQVAQIHCVLFIGFGIAVMVLAAEKASVSPLGVVILKWLQQKGITADGTITLIIILMVVLIGISFLLSVL